MATTRSSWAPLSAPVRSSIAAWRRRSTSASSSGPSDSSSTWPSTLPSRRTSWRSGAGVCSRSVLARAAAGGRSPSAPSPAGRVSAAGVSAAGISAAGPRDAEPAGSEGGGRAPGLGFLLMAAMVVAASAGEQREPDLAPGVVVVAVEQADPLPGAERRAAADHRDGERRAGQQRQQVVGAVPTAAMPMDVAVVLGQQPVQGILQVLLGARACLHHDQPSGGVRHEHLQQPILAARLAQEGADPRGQVDHGPAGRVDAELGGAHLPPRSCSVWVLTAQATGAARRGRQHGRSDRQARSGRRIGGAGAASAAALVALYAGGLDGDAAMKAPVDQPGSQSRAIVDGARLWTGGGATTLIVALIVLVGVLISRVVGVPGLAGDETGTLATVLLAGYAVMWAGTTLLLTGALHLLLLLVPRPLQRFALVASALVLMAVVAPFTAGTSHVAALAAALINLVAGVTAEVLLLRVGRTAFQEGRRRYLAPAARRGAAQVEAGPGQAGARRPRR